MQNQERHRERRSIKEEEDEDEEGGKWYLKRARDWKLELE